MPKRPTEIEFSKDLYLPRQALTKTFGYLATRGSGKSYAATKVAEGMLGIGGQVVAIDPVGCWFGLRLAADGKSKGFNIYVFGGHHGDIPLEPEAGALVAQLIIKEKISVVLDVSLFRKGQRKKFVTDFVEELFHLKKSNPSPLHLFIEESQVFAPQRIIKGEERMLGAIEDWFKIGRNYGGGGTLISQRPQSVNKDILNLTEFLAVGRITGPQERKVIEGWIREKDADVTDLFEELPKLPDGDFVVWCPQWLNILERIHVAKKRTFDSSRTPDIDDFAPAGTLPGLDLAKIEAQMKSVIERAQAADPELLRRQVSQLKAEVAKLKSDLDRAERACNAARMETEKAVTIATDKAKVAAPSPVKDAEIKRAQQRLTRLEEVAEGQRQKIAEVREAIEFLVKKAGGTMPLTVTSNTGGSHPTPNGGGGDRGARLVLLKPGTTARLNETRGGGGGGSFLGAPVIVARNVHGAGTIERRPVTADTNVNADLLALGKGPRMCLAVIAQHDGVMREQLTALTGYKRSTRDAYLYRLEQAGFAVISTRGFIATENGVAALGSDYEVLPTGDALLRHWLGKLPRGEREILRVLAAAYPRALSRDQISSQTGYDKRSTRDAYLYRLSTKKLAVEVDGSGFSASELLFDA